MNYVRESKPGFGLQVHGQPVDANVVTKDPHEMQLCYNTQDGIQVQRITSVTSDGGVKQTTILSNMLDKAVSVQVQLDLGMSLNRASYGQLTEGGPIPLPESLNQFHVVNDGSSFTLHNPSLKTIADGSFSIDSEDFAGMVFDDSPRTFHGQPVQCKAPTRVKVMPGAPITMSLSFSLRAEDSRAVTTEKQLKTDIHKAPKWKLRDSAALNIIHGNMEYVLCNCTIPTSGTSTCVITDHVALPLGWNRDN